MVRCGPVPDGVNWKLHVDVVDDCGDSVHGELGVKVNPPPEAVRSTVPVGADGVIGDVSVTVTVQLVAVSSVTVESTQLTTVEVARLVSLTVSEPVATPCTDSVGT